MATLGFSECNSAIFLIDTRSMSQHGVSIYLMFGLFIRVALSACILYRDIT